MYNFISNEYYVDKFSIPEPCLILRNKDALYK